MIFRGFWDQVGRQVEAKLVPKSKKTRYQDDVKKTSKIKRPGRAGAGPSRPRPGGEGPLKQFRTRTIRTTDMGILRFKRCHKGTVADKEIYIYIYV